MNSNHARSFHLVRHRAFSCAPAKPVPDVCAGRRRVLVLFFAAAAGLATSQAWAAGGFFYEMPLGFLVGVMSARGEDPATQLILGAGATIKNAEGSEIPVPTIAVVGPLLGPPPQFELKLTDLLAPIYYPFSTSHGTSDVASRKQSAPGLSAVPSAFPADASGSGTNVSRDGNTVVGYFDNGFSTPYHAFRWSEATGTVDLGTLDVPNNAVRSSWAQHVSSDGSVVVGYSELTAQGATIHAFRWTQGTGMVDLGAGSGASGSSRAFGVSGDGSVVVGESDFPGGFSGTVRQAFRWTSAGGFQNLGAVQDDYPSVANAVTADGSVVVGKSGIEVKVGNVSTNGSRAFRWTQNGGMQNLGALPGHEFSEATAVSDDGTIVIGNSSGDTADSARAFYWTETTGMQDLNQLFAAAGIDLGGRTITGARGLSADGVFLNLVVTTSTPNVTASAIASLTFTPPSQTSRLLNLSTRGYAQAGDNVLIPGFVISGTANKRLLIRAVGPTLADPPIRFPSAVIPDPRLTLKKWNPAIPPGGAYEDVTSNDDWGTNANATDIGTTGANLFAFELKHPEEAALLLDLAPGQYTVIAGDKNDTSGVAIVELYDADDDAVDSRLINISNRGFCGVGDQVMIPGFVVSSESSRTVLIRVVGPTLAGAPYNVSGTMADPKLVLTRSENGAITHTWQQDNWGDEADATLTVQIAHQLSAFPLADGSKDAAFVVTLPPGVYTVIGSAADGVSTGVVLVEVYVVP